ncbi:Janus/Ocnus family protein [Dictyocaulus viviparus]|uniref:Janus/Ocnus family protein n=1 Tax=Dictyocaulus viviparus TaxID=29172 RepID=A0A0D8XR31_DICVI|nr:Janus/Ocnus family protein [Dictyocaulus viviparus]
MSILILLARSNTSLFEQCADKSTKEEKYIVRGYYKCNFHANILDIARKNSGSLFELKCVGGGRIRHENDAKEILVYGYSQGYGQADHSITVDILKKYYPDYHITFSNEGY